MVPLLTPSQQARLRRRYFESESPEGALRFAQTCIALTRRGHSVGGFFDLEGLGELYQETLDEAMAAHLERRSGFVYLAAHPIYPQGLYKIGETRKTPDERMRSLTTSGIPGRFVLVKAWRVPDSFAAEASCVRTLSQRRIEREFYEGTFADLTKAIDGVVQREWDLFRTVSPAIELPFTSQ